MARWKKHDGSKRLPPGVGPQTHVEFEATWGGGSLPAGAIADWATVIRFKITGAALTASEEKGS